MPWLICRLWSYLESEDGATLVEYGMIVLLVAIATITVLPGVGSAVAAVFTRISTALSVP